MLTGAMLKSIAAAVPGGDTGTQVASWDELAAGCMEVAAFLGFTTARGLATFIANCCQESAYFRTTKEYEGEVADYAPYYGRGFIQLTWRSNYAAYGTWCQTRGLLGVTDRKEFVDFPDRVADIKHAWWTAAMYFTKTWVFGGREQSLVEIADSTGSNVVVARAINAGNPSSGFIPYGIVNRDALFDKACTFGDQLLPQEDDMTPEEHEWLSSIRKNSNYLATMFAPKTFENASLAAIRSGYVANTAVGVLSAQIRALQAQLQEIADTVGALNLPAEPVELPLPPTDLPDVPLPPVDELPILPVDPVDF
jgi:predicted chitinase